MWVCSRSWKEAVHRERDRAFASAAYRGADRRCVTGAHNSKSTSGGVLCVFAHGTVVPISWMSKKQSAVSHSSAKTEIISLDTALRVEGLPAPLFKGMVCITYDFDETVHDGKQQETLHPCHCLHTYGFH